MPNCPSCHQILLIPKIFKDIVTYITDLDGSTSHSNAPRSPMMSI